MLSENGNANFGRLTCVLLQRLSAFTSNCQVLHVVGSTTGMTAVAMSIIHTAASLPCVFAEAEDIPLDAASVCRFRYSGPSSTKLKEVLKSCGRHYCIIEIKCKLKCFSEGVRVWEECIVGQLQ